MEIRRIDNPNLPYVQKLLSLDEKICELLAEREKMAGEKPGIPKWDLVETWAERYQLDAVLLHRIFSIMARRQSIQNLIVPKNLRTVVPIMQRKEAHDCVFMLTHMMQYENSSVINLDIRYVGEHFIHLGPPNLFLTLNSDVYQIRNSRFHGGGQQYHMEYIITPALPDEIGDLRFGLEKKTQNVIPQQPQQLILDLPVVFDE